MVSFMGKALVFHEEKESMCMRCLKVIIIWCVNGQAIDTALILREEKGFNVPKAS